jgi:UbiD family decarboxylase
MYKDLRDFVESVEQLGALRRIDRADPQFEISAITEVAAGRPGGPALLFDDIKGFPRGFRILTNAVTSAPRAALALGLDPSMRPLDALKARPDDATQSRRRAPSTSQPSSNRWRNRERLRTEKSSTRRTTPREVTMSSQAHATGVGDVGRTNWPMPKPRR